MGQPLSPSKYFSPVPRTPFFTIKVTPVQWHLKTETTKQFLPQTVKIMTPILVCAAHRTSRNLPRPNPGGKQQQVPIHAPSALALHLFPLSIVG